MCWEVGVGGAACNQTLLDSSQMTPVGLVYIYIGLYTLETQFANFVSEKL